MPETTHSPPHRRVRRGILASVVAVAMLALPVLFAGPASAAVPTTVAVNGANPVDLGVQVSQATFPAAGSANAVLVIRDDDPVDALSASALAGVVNGPILATPTGSLAVETANEIARVLAPGGAIYILGGTDAVSAAVEADLQGIAPVQRIGGPDRYDTSARVAETIGGAAPFGGLNTVIVANGITFVDALASGPLAWLGHPILLTSGTSLNAEVVQAMGTVGAQQALIMGGPAVIDSAVRGQIAGLVGGNVIGIAGVNRYDSAAELSQALLNNAVYPPANVVLAPGISLAGFNYYPALFAGYHGGAVGSTMVLTSSVPPYTASFLTFNANGITNLTGVQVDGGTLNQAAQIVDQGSVNVPSVPRDVKAAQLPGSTDTANVVWVEPASDGGSPVTDYQVTASGGPVAGPNPRAVGGPGTSFDFSGLSVGSTYTFTVVAVNANGNGPTSAPSNPVTITAAPTPPNPPGNPTAAWSGADNAVIVTWDPPAGNIDHYQIEARQGGATVLTVFTPGTYMDIDRCLPGTPPPCLPPGTYDFNVSAVNTDGLESNPATTNPVTVPTP